MERPVGRCVYSTSLYNKYYSLREVGPNSHKERANFGFYVRKESNFYELAIMQDVCSDFGSLEKRFIKSLNLDLLFTKHENG